MNKRLTIGLGLGLISIGMMALASGLLGVLFDFRVWHLWPIVVILAGLGIVLPAALGKQGAKLGWLYILGLPTLTTGGDPARRQCIQIVAHLGNAVALGGGRHGTGIPLDGPQGALPRALRPRASYRS